MVKLQPLDKRFHPYGTRQALSIRGMGEVTLRAKAGLTTKTVVYVNNSNTENSLLNEMDAKRMGIIEVRVEGSSKEVKIHWEKQTKKVCGLLGKDIPNELVADGVSQATSSHLLQSSVTSSR